MIIYSFRPDEKFQNLELTNYKLINIPLTKTVPITPRNFPDLDQFDGIAFLSSSAAKYFLAIFDGSESERMKIFSIGNKTSEILRSRFQKIIEPRIHDSDGLCAVIANAGCRNILVPRGEIHDSRFEETLGKYSIKAIEMTVYSYEKGEGQKFLGTREMKKDGSIFVFTSSLEVNIFKNLTGNAYSKAKVFAIGPTTKKTLETNGFRNILGVGNGDFENLIRKIDEHSGEWI